MALFNSSFLIKELRNGKGLTQTQLAEGICSRQTITAIEKGERKPDWYTFSLIMRKLDINPHQYFASVANEDEVYVFNEAVKWQPLFGTMDNEAIKAAIKKADNDKRFASGTGKRYLLSLKRAFYSSKGPYQNLDLSNQYALEDLKIGRPDFDIEKITDYYLTSNEVQAIADLLNNYGYAGDYDKAITLRMKLIENYEQRNQLVEHIARTLYISEILNLTYNLYEAKRYGECIEWADKGLAFALGDIFTVSRYMRVLKNKAKAQIRLGQKEEGDLLMKRYLFFAYGVGENGDANVSYEVTKKDFEENFRYRLDLSLPW
jgi:DNA-binding XRE family transcriptional regulator